MLSDQNIFNISASSYQHSNYSSIFFLSPLTYHLNLPRPVITTLPHSIENIISWPKVVKSDRTTQGSRAVMTVAQSSRMRGLVTKTQIVTHIAYPVIHWTDPKKGVLCYFFSSLKVSWAHPRKGVRVSVRSA